KMVVELATTTKSTISEPAPQDAQYIWLPFLVLVGVAVLAGLVYAMSRNRRSCLNCSCFKRVKATRSGYINVDINENDSDVSMAMGEDFTEVESRYSLMQGRLHIATVSTLAEFM
ncbi:CG5039, partial [Drosophila busckii]